MSEGNDTTHYESRSESGRFRKGDGRRRGHRLKGSLNKKTIAQRQLDIANKPETLRKKDGTAVRLSPREVVTTRLKNLAMTKDDKAAFKLFLDHVDQLERTVAATKTESYPFTDQDRTVMAEMYRRMKACKGDVDE